MDAEKTIASLRRFPLFQRMAEPDLAALAALTAEETFPAGQTIIREGDEGDTMYLLLEGEADIVKTTVYGDEYVTAGVSAADFCVFGEMALIDRAPRSASVAARTACRTLRIGREEFQSYCRQYPAVGCELLFLMASTLVRSLRKENENLRLVYQALIEEVESD